MKQQSFRTDDCRKAEEKAKDAEATENMENMKDMINLKDEDNTEESEKVDDSEDTEAAEKVNGVENAVNAENTELVVRRYADMVYRLAFARTGNRHDADEIFQEVFLRYIKKNPVFESEEHRKAWLIRVAVNCSKKLWGSPWKRRTEPLEAAGSLENAAEWQEEDSRLHGELCRLPEKYREVIHLFYYEDMSLEEISRALNRKNSTVRTQLTRARAMLRDILKEDSDV